MSNFSIKALFVGFIGSFFRHTKKPFSLLQQIMVKDYHVLRSSPRAIKRFRKLMVETLPLYAHSQQ